MFLSLIAGNFQVLYYTGQTAQVLKFSNSKVHHFKFIRGRYARLMLAIISGALPSQKFYFLFFFLFCIFQFYITKFQVCCCFRTVEIVKERSCAMPLLKYLFLIK